jgi:hypothetical protein
VCFTFYLIKRKLWFRSDRELIALFHVFKFPKTLLLKGRELTSTIAVSLWLNTVLIHPWSLLHIVRYSAVIVIWLLPLWELSWALALDVRNQHVCLILIIHYVSWCQVLHSLLWNDWVSLFIPLIPLWNIMTKPKATSALWYYGILTSLHRVTMAPSQVVYCDFCDSWNLWMVDLECLTLNGCCLSQRVNSWNLLV